MRKFMILALLAMGLTACDSTTFNAQEQVYLQQDLNAICPNILALDPLIRSNTNGNVGVALDDVELLCPPNLPPTNIVIAAADIITIAISLKPYIPRLTVAAQKAVANAQGIAAAHGIATP